MMLKAAILHKKHYLCNKKIMQKCKNCGKEFYERPVNIAKGWGLFCSKSCRSKVEKKDTSVKQFNQFKAKFVDQVAFPQSPPLSRDERFTILCPTHGEMQTNLIYLKRNTHACHLCGIKKQTIRDGEKQCSKCNEWKPVSQYKVEKKKRPAARCIDCERLRQREGAKHWDKEKRKETIKRFTEKKKASTPRSSHITICTCEQCNKLWVRKGKVVKRFCSSECGIKSRHQQRIGKPLIITPREYNCKECGELFTNTKPGRCKPCSAILKHDARKAHKKRRKAAIKTVALHNVIDRKVFERDKWRCCSCGIKVQKKDHLKDNAAEVDHIVPVSLGGPHSYSNVQTLCRRCNQKKSNTFNGQLVLAI